MMEAQRLASTDLDRCRGMLRDFAERSESADQLLQHAYDIGEPIGIRKGKELAEKCWTGLFLATFRYLRAL
jgi:hypothetical protein